MKFHDPFSKNDAYNKPPRNSNDVRMVKLMLIMRAFIGCTILPGCNRKDGEIQKWLHIDDIELKPHNSFFFAETDFIVIVLKR